MLNLSPTALQCLRHFAGRRDAMARDAVRGVLRGLLSEVGAPLPGPTDAAPGAPTATLAPDAREVILEALGLPADAPLETVIAALQELFSEPPAEPVPGAEVPTGVAGMRIGELRRLGTALSSCAQGSPTRACKSGGCHVGRRCNCRRTTEPAAASNVAGCLRNHPTRDCPPRGCFSAACRIRSFHPVF